MFDRLTSLVIWNKIKKGLLWFLYCDLVAEIVKHFFNNKFVIKVSWWVN